MENNKIRFIIPGEPYGKGRPKFSTKGGFIRAVTPEKTINYEALVKMEFQHQCPGVFFDRRTAIGMLVICNKPIPKSTSKKNTAKMLNGEIRPGKKPDWDNAGKIVCDALNGLAFLDDAQIVDGRVIKKYVEIPSVIVEMWEEGING